MAIKATEVSVNLPFGLGGVKFEANVVEKRAAWVLYFELATRITTRSFDLENARLRSAFESLHSLFGLTRETLREAGPEVAHGSNSLGMIAIAVLNDGLAPFLSRWHNRLEAYEALRPSDVNAFEYERAWPHFNEAVNELELLQSNIREYVDVLGEISGVYQP